MIKLITARKHYVKSNLEKYKNNFTSRKKLILEAELDFLEKLITKL